MPAADALQLITVVPLSPVQVMEEALLAAAESGDLPAVEGLLAQGCPVNAQNEVKYTHLPTFHQTLSSSMFP